MEVKMIYVESGEDGCLFPIWMIVDSASFKWEETLYLNIKAPFERLYFYDLEFEIASVTVPDFAYIRNHENNDLFGISLPVVHQHAINSLDAEFDISQIKRLVLRITDIEDSLQYHITPFLTNRMKRW